MADALADNHFTDLFIWTLPMWVAAAFRFFDAFALSEWRGKPRWNVGNGFPAAADNVIEILTGSAFHLYDMSYI